MITVGPGAGLTAAYPDIISDKVRLIFAAARELL